jgi:hypothetical protein
MARAIEANPPHKRASQQGEISECIQYLVSHRLIRVSQPTGIQHTSLVEHDRVGQAGPSTKPLAPQPRRIAEQAKRPSADQSVENRVATDPDMLATDELVRKVDGALDDRTIGWHQMALGALDSV